MILFTIPEEPHFHTARFKIIMISELVVCYKCPTTVSHEPLPLMLGEKVITFRHAGLIRLLICHFPLRLEWFQIVPHTTHKSDISLFCSCKKSGMTWPKQYSTALRMVRAFSYCDIVSHGYHSWMLHHSQSNKPVGAARGSNNRGRDREVMSLSAQFEAFHSSPHSEICFWRLETPELKKESC